MDGEELPEIEIQIEPRVALLQELGVTREEFEQALSQALDAYHDLLENTDDPDAVPDLEELTIDVNGKALMLGDVAEIRITGEF